MKNGRLHEIWTRLVFGADKGNEILKRQRLEAIQAKSQTLREQFQIFIRPLLEEEVYGWISELPKNHQAEFWARKENEYVKARI